MRYLHPLLLLVSHLDLFVAHRMHIVNLDLLGFILNPYLLGVHEIPTLVKLIVNQLETVLAEEAEVVGRDFCGLLTIIGDHFVSVAYIVCLPVTFRNG